MTGATTDETTEETDEKTGATAAEHGAPLTERATRRWPKPLLRRYPSRR